MFRLGLVQWQIWNSEVCPLICFTCTSHLCLFPHRNWQNSASMSRRREAWSSTPTPWRSPPPVPSLPVVTPEATAWPRPSNLHSRHHWARPPSRRCGVGTFTFPAPSPTPSPGGIGRWSWWSPISSWGSSRSGSDRSYSSRLVFFKLVMMKKMVMHECIGSQRLWYNIIIIE